MSKDRGAETSLSEIPGSHGPRRLSEGLNPTGAKKVHSNTFYCVSKSGLVKAGCGKTARPVVCPAKAGMFSRRPSCRGKSQPPRSLDSRVAGNQHPEACRQSLPGEAASHRAVTQVNAEVAPKVRSPEGRADNCTAKAAWAAEG